MISQQDKLLIEDILEHIYDHAVELSVHTYSLMEALEKIDLPQLEKEVADFYKKVTIYDRNSATLEQINCMRDIVDANSS